MINLFLLSTDDQAALRLLEEMAERPATPMLVAELRAGLKMSPYKMNRLFEQLNADLEAVSENHDAYLEKIGVGIWRLHGVTQREVEHLRLRYLQRSSLFPAFEYHFFYRHQVTKTAYIKQHYLSTAKFYATSQELEKRLSNRPKLRAGRNTGNEEFDIRLFLFQFYYVLFNGIQEPFPEVSGQADTVAKQLIKLFDLSLTPSQKMKLHFFLEIWLLRLGNKQTLGDVVRFSEILVPHPDELEGLVAVIPQNLRVTKVELDYLYSFLVTQEFLDEQTLQKEISPQRYANAYLLADRFMDEIASTTFFKPLLDDERRSLKQQIFRLNVQMRSFYLPPMIYLRHEQLNHIRGYHPGLDLLIASFLADNQKDDIFGKNPLDLSSFYCSYLFLLLAYFPRHKSIELVHVCVDFSQGQFYSDYIAEQVRGLRMSYIKIETRLTAKTDVYLTDFPVAALKIPQVVWSNPPSEVDWGVLIDTLLSLRQAQLAKYETDAETKDINAF